MKCNIERGKGRTALISKKPQIFSRITFRRIAFNLLIAWVLCLLHSWCISLSFHSLPLCNHWYYWKSSMLYYIHKLHTSNWSFPFILRPRSFGENPGGIYSAEAYWSLILCGHVSQRPGYWVQDELVPQPDNGNDQQKWSPKLTCLKAFGKISPFWRMVINPLQSKIIQYDPFI